MKKKLRNILAYIIPGVDFIDGYGHFDGVEAVIHDFFKLMMLFIFLIIVIILILI